MGNPTINTISHPFALQLFSTETQKPISTLFEFESLSYSRSKNEAARVTITFPAEHPANKAIRDIYTAEPHGIYGILYRRGEPWAGLVLAETDITASPISWSFIGFESLLREHKTPWNWFGLEGLTIRQALTLLCEKYLRWHPKSGTVGLGAAVKSDTEVKTWSQMGGEVENGAYDQPSIVLVTDWGRYKASGTATFQWDFGVATQLSGVRFTYKAEEKTSIAEQHRTSADGITWSAWSAEFKPTEEEDAEKRGVAISGTTRFLEVKFTLRTTDFDSRDSEDQPRGKTPALYGVEALTAHPTGITAYSLDVPVSLPGEPGLDVALKAGFDFSHENHMLALASICDDYGYTFKVDHNKRLYVWKPSPSNLITVKKGETCEPSLVSYRSLESIENVLTCYGAGEGLGRLYKELQDTDSITLYGRRPGVFEDGKVTTLEELESKGLVELEKRAWPKLEAQIKAPYEDGRGVLNARLHDYIQYIDSDVFTGIDFMGQQTFEVLSESRNYGPDGELVTLGLNSYLDNLFTKTAKDGVRQRYKHGKAVGLVPYDVRAAGHFGAITVSWHGAAKEYSVEVSEDGLDGWAPIGRTANRNFTHTQLAAEVTRYYRVRAFYEGAPSAPSAMAWATTLPLDTTELDTTPPAKPTGLAASTTVLETTAGAMLIVNTLSWTLNNEPDVAYYELLRDTDVGGSTMRAMGVIGSDKNSFMDTAGLVENTTYYYWLRAIDKVGNKSELSDSTFVLTAKDATSPTFADTPPEVTAGFKRLVPRWEGSTSADISHYILERQEIPASWNGTTWETPSLSLTNLLSNSDFSGGSTGWTSTFETSSFTGGEFAGTAASQYKTVQQVIASYANYKGHKLYFACKFAASDPNPSSVLPYVNDGTTQVNGLPVHTGGGTYQFASNVMTISTAATALIFKLQDNRSTGWTQVKLDNAIVIDLTAAFGLGHEPTKDEVDAILTVAYPTNKWFSGTALIDTNSVETAADARAVNFILGGNLDNGLTVWVPYAATLAMSSNTLTVTCNGTQKYAIGRKYVPALTVGHKYYARAKARVTNTSCTALWAYWSSSQLFASVSNPTVNTWYILSGVAQASAAHTLLDIYHNYADAATANGKVMEVQKVLAVDLTETFGAGFEPTASEFEAMLAAAYPTDSWFEHIAYFTDTSGAWQVNTLKTATNLVSNGNFPNTTGWTAVDCSLAVASNIMSCTALGGGPNPYPWASFGQQIITTGRKLYVRAKIRLTNSDATFMRIYLINASTRLSVANYVTINTPVANEWYDVAFLATLNTTTAGADLGISIQALYPTKELASGKVMQIQYVSAIDLTSMFGAGNEPHEALIDAIIGDASPTAHWFQGSTKLITSRSRAEWEAITDSAIRALQYHDTDVEFDYAYRYKVAAVDTSGNKSAFTLPSAWAAPLQIGATDAAYRFITAEMYGEIRNTLPWTWRQELDSSKPIEVPFYIPSETTQIVSIKLSAYGNRFRATSTGASGGGAHDHSVTLVDHVHTIDVSESWGATVSNGAHTHSVSGDTGQVSDHSHQVVGATSTDSGHSHTVDGTTYFDGAHDHSIINGSAASAGGHSHGYMFYTVLGSSGGGGAATRTTTESTAHTHNLVYGIYESTTPAGVNLYIDNGAGYGSAIPLASAPDTSTPYALATELDITAHVSSVGWKKLKLTSTRLGAIDLQLICKVDLTA